MSGIKYYRLAEGEELPDELGLVWSQKVNVLMRELGINVDSLLLRR